MVKFFKYTLLVGLSLFLINVLHAQQRSKSVDIIERSFLNPPASAKPWVFWYWMHGAVSKAGITADLEAMKEVGIGGAYLMPIKDTTSSIPFEPTVRQLSPEWWDMVKFAMQEAKRLDLQLAMHVSDGFALAGGPWITPELSMQKLVWTKAYVKAGFSGTITLDQPETVQGYYKDVAVFAYPSNSTNAFSDEVLVPSVTTSNCTNAQFLSFPDSGNKQSFRSDSACWIQYKYPKPFTCRSIRIHTGSNSYQAQRLIIQTSEDGVSFKTITRLNPPRHGWQDTEEDYTHAIAATTSRYFRFVYNKEGSEPGSEDLDAAKWRPSLRVMGIYLSDEPVINQYEAKNGSVWRVATHTTEQQVSKKDAVSLPNIINLTNKLSSDGKLDWTKAGVKLPANTTGWVVVRIGHTSTGQTNATGGAGKGLECDKFNAAAVKLQFDNWFGKAFEKTDPVLAKEVLKVFHVDSWECGSQNWSTNFANEFKKRRGYELTPYLLVMTGTPVTDAATSEKILHDIRLTIAELVNEVFYATLNKLAHEKGCSFSAESVAPTFVSDGLMHYKNVDVPMGEFWLNSPTHDKPNDMLDAISGAHIYGKNIIQAEAFTSVRMNWGEHPGILKAVGDRNFALGINKMVLHVFTHNPWMDKKPGMTLDGVGLYFQRDQTWFKQGKVWIEYLTRCQALLQLGKPVVDIAVFTGEEVPRRSILPDRLVNTLPGIFGNKRVESEKRRLANVGQPLRQIPNGVTNSANMADPENWVDPMRGYAYDSFNPDALMNMSVKNGKVLLPSGASYSVLVFPGQHPMQPNVSISLAVAKKIAQLAREGATIIIDNSYFDGIGLPDTDDSIRQVMKEVMNPANKKGMTLLAPYIDSSFAKLGIQRDVEVADNIYPVAWTHRQLSDADVYFISNQKDSAQPIRLRLQAKGNIIEVWDPVTKGLVRRERQDIGRKEIRVELDANQSFFIIVSNTRSKAEPPIYGRPLKRAELLYEWTLRFDTAYGGPAEPVNWRDIELGGWTEHRDNAVRYYSGTAVYTLNYKWDGKTAPSKAWLKFQRIYCIATVKVNGIVCDTLWTFPYKVDIAKAMKPGDNKIEVEVTNTWGNRLLREQLVIPGRRVTWTTAPLRTNEMGFRLAGINGRVHLEIE